MTFITKLKKLIGVKATITAEERAMLDRNDYYELIDLVYDTANPAVLAELAECEHIHIRQSVAMNEATSVETLKLLADDADDSVSVYALVRL